MAPSRGGLGERKVFGRPPVGACNAIFKFW